MDIQINNAGEIPIMILYFGALIFGALVGIFVLVAFIHYRNGQYAEKTHELLNLKELKQKNKMDDQ